MTEPDVKVAANASVPRGTLMKRYKRIQIRGIAVIACLFVIALFALLTIGESYTGPGPHWHTRNPQRDLDNRITEAFLEAIIAILRACGLSMTGVRITLVVVVLLCVAAAGGVVLHIRRKAPPKAQKLPRNLRKKEAVVQ